MINTMVVSAIAGRARDSATPKDAMGQARRTHTDRGVYRRFQAALLAGSLVIGAARSEAQSPVKQVLVLQSLDRGNLTLDTFTNNFRVGLDQRVGKPVNVVQVVVGPTGFVGAPEEVVVDYIRSMYADRAPPDLVMTVGGPAALFARKHRQRLFPSTPLLFAAMDQQFLSGAPLAGNETAVAVVNDWPGLIDEILKVLPETKQVFMVIGSGVSGRSTRPDLKTGFERFQGRLNLFWSDQLSLPEILHHVAVLPAHSVIVYRTFGSDAQGGAYPAEQVIAGLHAMANAPMFSAQSPYLGLGVVGGSMLNIVELARRSADVASRILNGEPPATLRVPPQVRGQPIYDWRELRRWGIPESRLPPGSVVRFREPTLWQEHKVTVLVAVGTLLIQSFLIALLLYERRARQRAEIESRRNLSLAADANRRETISALTSSIGHELGQPLSAIMHNAQTLQMMVAANRAAPDTTEEIATDIQAEAVLAGQIIERHRTMLHSRQLEKKTIDLNRVIEESVALFAYDMRARQVDATLELSSTPCVIDGDQVLLGQVLVNLLRNAIDALAETPPGMRRITIRSAVKAADVEISVSDTGPGLPKEIAVALFTPFVTTKSHGLGIGLAIAQRIVDAHRGSIAAHENVNGGATFTVTLPRSAMLRFSQDGQAHPEDSVAAAGD